MAIIKKKIGQVNNTPAQRQFTDREEPQESFIRALEDINSQDYSILTYYGVGGIGKSSLQKHLKTEYLDKDENAVYSYIDFDTEANRTTHKALRILAKKFKANSKISFTTFDIAYIIFWSKAFPDYDIKKEGLPFLEEGSILSGAVDVVSDVGGMMGVALSVIQYATDKVKEISFNQDIQNELKELNVLEADEIEKQLAIFFANDIDNYKLKNPEKKVVIFLDTYEALWQSNRSEANSLSKDEWIRDGLVTQLQNVLFVICGREKIRWSEVDDEWEKYLNQHILGNLSKEDARSFLDSCEITDIEIQNKMIESSEGLPYYLDLCVDTFYQIVENDVIPMTIDFDEVGKEKIFERFMRYLTPQEQETLKVLANARFYTKELFSLLIDKFKTGYPITAMNQLNIFSFISEDDGAYYMHDLMRKSLISFQNNELNENVNNFLFEHYNSELQNLDIQNISQSNIESLPEAFYHKNQLGDIELLSAWYWNVYNIFEKAAKYKYILETTINLKCILDNKLGEEHTYTATSYHNLAELYTSIGNYQKALPLYEKALLIRKKIFGEMNINTAETYDSLSMLHTYMCNVEAIPLLTKTLSIKEQILGKEHPEIAKSYNLLSSVYGSRGNYKEALNLNTKALSIFKKVLGEEHRDTAESYRVLAKSYIDIDNYNEAVLLYLKSIDIVEKLFGEEHPDTAESYNNLGILYEIMGKYKESVLLQLKAISIYEKLFGEEHPAIATSYNNLAFVYESMGNYEELLDILEKVLSIRKKVLGEEHPLTVGSYKDLGKCYLSNGRIDEAVNLMEKAFLLEDKFKEKSLCRFNKLQ